MEKLGKVVPDPSFPQFSTGFEIVENPQVFVFIGRGDRIRTYDPCLPKAVLYQAELHPDGVEMTN